MKYICFGQLQYSGRTCLNPYIHLIFFLSDCTQPWQRFSSFRPRTRCVTSLTPRISTPLPPRLSPKQRPRAKRPLQAGTHPPPPTLPPASPLKVKWKTQIWEQAQSFPSSSSGEMLNEVHLLELFFIGIDVFALLQDAQVTSLSWKRHKYVL